MRREGRQHGMVRTHMVLSPPFNSKPKKSRRILNKLEAPVIAGVYAKVPSKPTNHSKFTGRCCNTMCTSCHLRPASKSKAKSKGNHKFRSSRALILDFVVVIDDDDDDDDDDDELEDEIIGSEVDHKGDGDGDGDGDGWVFI
ncbi:hypothetical protein J5N97_012791 [Dioscorea zingiberensis]|uniref:Uncharacterized protein n=1 Tax=Dioscorea zingiberensis TaxID=325984 RepID=A0A9D5CQZ5_9LILI|nr:hypothetical protein J5N97_012791 [Dioscorea zingiberensis]